MTSRIKKKINSSFVKNTLTLVTGTAGAQVITMLASPLITRLYGPEAFGLMGAFLAIANIIIPISALTYPIAIVLPKDEKEAIKLVHLSVFVSVFLSFLSLITLLLFNKEILSILKLNEIGNFILFIPLIVIFAGIMQTAKQWLIRTNQFSINAKASFYQSVIINGGKVGVGLFYPIASVLLIFSILINAVRASIMIYFAKIPKIDFKKYLIRDRKETIGLAKKYYDFPLFRAPESFITGISHGVPVLMLTAFFGPASAGFYSIGRSVLSIPSQLIGEAVGDVFYPKITEIYNENRKISPIIGKATLALFGIGLVPYGMVILFGPFLFSFVFGADWIMAGEYARWIALWSFTNFFNKPSVRTLAVINAQRYHLLYTIIGLVIKVIALIVGFYMFESDIMAVMFFGISGAILNLGLITMTMYLSYRKQQ